MGNAQSAGHHSQHHSPHHNRLSKPKTNTNSPALAPKADSPISVASQYASLSARERHQIKTQLLSPVDTDFGQRESFDGDDELGELATNVQRRLSTLSRSNSLSCFGNGRGSTTKLASLPGSKVSLVSTSQVVDLDTALKILQEVKRNASPDDLAALHQALQPSPSSPSPRPSAIPEEGLSRRTSIINRSTSSLIRRRSLIAAPGVATRTSPVEGKRRKWSSWQTPRVEPQEQSKWRMDMMGTSPLARLAGLDLAEQGRDSPTPRAQTPGEMEYSHLGSLKLGSLRIANGAPSPAPSAKISRRKSNPNLSPEEDYFTASETCESPIMMKPTKRRGHTRSKSAIQPTTPPLYRNSRLSGQNRGAKPISTCDSPLKSATQSGPSYDEPESEPVRRLRVMNKSADTLARDYQAEIPNSPFDPPQQWATLDHDEGFASDDAKSFREEAFRILDGTIFGEPATAAIWSKVPEARPMPTAEMSSEKPKKQKKANKRPPPKKADSGYSSGGSFRTLHHGALKEGTVPTLSTKPFVVADIKSGNGSDSDDAGSLYTFEQMLHLPVSKPLPPVPANEDVTPRPESLRIPHVTEDGSVGSRLSDPIARVLDVHSLSNGSPKTPVSVVSQFSVDSKASTQRRLQKRQPSSQELPVVQSCDPVPEGTIPNVPDNVRSKFVRRLSEAPEMECLTRTYQSKDHINDEESMVDSPVAVTIKFPSPSASPEPRGRKHHRRSATERPPTPPPHGIRRSLSLFRRKSSAEKEKESNHDKNAAPSVVDLGTLATSLGRSPYDVAMATVPKKMVTSPTHPHQLGNALPRAKSMVNMDAQTAAEIARMRSKDRALLRPEMPQRPRSYHDMNLEAGEGVAYRWRPHSFYGDVPPVPSIEANRDSGIPNAMEYDQAEQQFTSETASGPSFRARSTGRGPVVSQLIDRFDKHGEKIVGQNPTDWESHARLWSQRRKSIGEGLRQRAEESQPRSFAANGRVASQPEGMAVIDRYSGGLDYGYEGRGYGIGGSAGTRQLHSYASRKSMHFSNQYGVDLSDVPVFLQRA